MTTEQTTHGIQIHEVALHKLIHSTVQPSETWSSELAKQQEKSDSTEPQLDCHWYPGWLILESAHIYLRQTQTATLPSLASQKHLYGS